MKRDQDVTEDLVRWNLVLWNCETKINLVDELMRIVFSRQQKTQVWKVTISFYENCGVNGWGRDVEEERQSITISFCTQLDVNQVGWKSMHENSV